MAGEEEGWDLPKTAIDLSGFRVRLGPYRLGSVVRRTRHGETLLAIDPGREPVLEVDLYDAFRNTSLTTPAGVLMGDIAQVVDLHHRHVAKIVGSGFHEGVPYVVRMHRLGVTLAELELQATHLSPAFSVGVLAAVAEAVDFLSEQGREPGACSVGGIESSDVFLGFDGSILMVGIGLRSARRPDGNALDADQASLLALGHQLDDLSLAGLGSAIASASTPREVARAARRRDPEACAESRRHVAQALREHFADRIAKDRAFFGLSTLH